jgi:hypothetical protein
MEELVGESRKTLLKQAKKHKLPQDKEGLVEAIEAGSKENPGFHKDPLVIYHMAYLQGAADAYDVTLMGLLDEAL